jgi:ABC-type Mn2+/Zn2+ transport system ATPase subunit
MTTHDFTTLERYANQVVLMDRTVLAKGSPTEVLSSEAFQETFHCKGGGVK